MLISLVQGNAQNMMEFKSMLVDHWLICLEKILYHLECLLHVINFFIHIYIYSYAIFSMSIGIGFTPNTNGVYNAKHRRYLDHHTRHSPRNFLQQRGHRNSLLRLSWRQKKTHAYLVGGWTNPSEKYESNWKSSPNRSDNNFFLSCHHPDMNQHREREDSRMGVHHQELLWFSISRWKPPTAFADFSESKLRSATCTFQKYIENSWSQGFQTKTSWITISFQRIKHLVYIYIYIYMWVVSPMVSPGVYIHSLPRWISIRLLRLLPTWLGRSVVGRRRGFPSREPSHIPPNGKGNIIFKKGLRRGYWWWKKSCTTQHAWNLVNNGIFTISTGAGFLPSTVC